MVYSIPLVHGFISIRNITINGKICTFHLISRRSWHRAGKEREREKHSTMVVFIIIIIIILLPFYCSVSILTFSLSFLPPLPSPPLPSPPPGVRYYMRGIDDDGFAANFVETEQFVHYEGHTSSFVQVITHVHVPYSTKFFEGSKFYRFYCFPSIRKNYFHKNEWMAIVM